MEPKPKFKVWLETDEGYVFGPGVYSLLKQIKKSGKLTDASKALEMSYRHAWGLIKKAEETLGESLLSRRKGGKAGGGGTELTKLGEEYLVHFERLMSFISTLSESPQLLSYASNITQKAEIIQITREGNNAVITLSLQEYDKISATLPWSKVKKMKLEEGNRVKLSLMSFLSNIDKL